MNQKEKVLFNPLYMAVLCMFIACRSFKPQIQVGGFNFDYNGKICRIEGVTPNYQEGYNILTCRDQGKLVFKAVDSDQDGALDDILAGTIALEEAEKIYQAGLDYGYKSGLIHQRTLVREFEYQEAQVLYRIATLILLRGETYNKFQVIPPALSGPAAVLIDEGSDGELDRMEKGHGSLKDYQDIYQHVIEKGIRVGKIKRVNSQYIVTL